MLPLPLVCALLCLFGAWLCRELRAYVAAPALAETGIPRLTAFSIGRRQYLLMTWRTV